MNINLLRPVVFADLAVGDKLRHYYGTKAAVVYKAPNFVVLRFENNSESTCNTYQLEKHFRHPPLCWVENKPVYPGDGPLYYKDNPSWKHNEEGVFALSIRGDELLFHGGKAFPIDTTTWTKPQLKRVPSFQVEGVDVYPGDTVYYYGDDKHSWGREMVVEKDGFVNGVHADSFSKGTATFRLKPQLVIGDHLVPMPEREAPAVGSVYYTPNLSKEEMYLRYDWNNDGYDLRLLERGLVHLNRQAAITHGQAIVALSEKES